MEVIVNAKKSTAAFSALKVGQCFMLDGRVMIKTHAGGTDFAQCIGSPERELLHRERECLLVSRVEVSM